ncbi:MAG: hypothetical protein RL757_862 [Bacteroidota bacterium]|jgi:cell division protein FtsI (penicillin-binding protein 3)
MALINIKDQVLARAYVVTSIVALVAFAIFTKAFGLVTIRGKELRQKAAKEQVEFREVPGERGNILSEDGSLLATSLRFFDVHMDCSVVRDADFKKNIDSLGMYLAFYVDSRFTSEQWSKFLNEHKYVHNSRYVPIAKNISLEQLSFIKTFPLFRLGKTKGGLIADRKSRREHPFKMLGMRTIGYAREDIKLGIEGFYDKDLSGDKGKVLMQKVGDDIWIPVNGLSEIDPKDGSDIITTLDVNMQEITQTALVRALEFHQAEHGCAIVMEVKTGKIKAISNIGRTKDSTWWETFNYGIGDGIEPGSTFKTASMLALLEDNAVRLSDTVEINGGVTQFYDQKMEDHERTPLNKVSVLKAFASSSNVGIATMTNNYYASRKDQYVQHLKNFFLTVPTGIDLDGEAAPKIKNPNSASDNWSGTTLPWMSIGYELEITPLQLLNFYNTIANDGRVMKPYLVNEIQRYGETIRKNRPTIVKERIAKAETIEQIKTLLEAVVEQGTASHLRTERYRFAGKTGTAQLDYEKKTTKTSIGGYQASFVGYFPAEKPIYSCIVVISKPRANGYYGGLVAGPVFREIADRMMASNVRLAESVNTKGKPVLGANQLPDDAGYKPDMAKTVAKLNLPITSTAESGDNWTILKAAGDKINIATRNVGDKTLIPSVVGMGLRDALFILENRGVRVKFSGYGKVVAQSLNPGAPAKGAEMSIRLE